MALTFTREYNDILSDITNYLLNLENFYEFFEMNKNDFDTLSDDEKKELAKTLSDDIFYTVKEEGHVYFEDTTFKYDKKMNVINAICCDSIITVIKLD